MSDMYVNNELFVLPVTLPYLENNSVVLIHNCAWSVF